MISNITLLRYLKYPFFSLRGNRLKGHCFACGDKTNFLKQKVINDKLAKEWNLSFRERNAFDMRESLICHRCQNSYRTRNLAKAIVKVFGGYPKSLKDLIADNKEFRKLRIAEINSCGNLHPILKKCPNLYYSEYGGIYFSKRQSTENAQKIRNEDLQNVTYKDNFFDLVLTSDTLEHVPDLSKSIKEIYRVLKHGGYHIFTVPVILNRKTRERIKIVHGKRKKILSDSYHGSGEKDNIVYREFGGDIIKILEEKGFGVELHFFNFLKDDYSFVFVTQKIK